ncbi:MAG: glycosyltransferase family 4 protein [Parcubacteria group bacterium]|nr:glycosyltransferase family 4 protein [Parcubacteria group bacterium]
MKIGIILHPYDEDKPAGLARTIFELTKGMLDVDSQNEYYVFLKNTPKTPPQFPGENWKFVSLGGGRFWLEKLRNAPRCDVYIFNTPVMPFFWKPPKSIIIALDFAYWYLADKTLDGQLKKLITFLIHGYSLKKADAIVAISHATKEETARLFKIPEGKIDVVYCGFKRICVVPEKRVPLPTEKFFFFAGILKLRKNILNIVKAFHVFQGAHPDYSLVLAGNPSGGKYFDSVLRFIEENKLTEKIHFVGHLNDPELSYVYKRTEAFLFPTLIEGFGYPVLEAMDCGVPVITSNQSSLREVGGEGSALLVDPYEPKDIAAAMREVVESSDKKEKLITAGFVRAKQFSWRKAGEELLEIVKRIHHVEHHSN